MNVMKMVQEYFERNNFRNYELIGVRPLNKKEEIFAVLTKYIGNDEYKQDTYTVWTGFDAISNCLYSGHYDLDYETAINLFNGQTIPYDRIVELTTKLKDKLIEDDSQYAAECFECLGMSDQEYDFFGINKPKRFKTVEVEVTYTVPVIIPKDEDEEMFDYDDYLSEYYTYDQIDIRTSVTNEEIKASELNSYQNYYGYSDCRDML